MFCQPPFSLFLNWFGKWIQAADAIVAELHATLGVFFLSGCI